MNLEDEKAKVCLLEGDKYQKRKSMGRAARRRRAKSRSIDQALEALLRGEDVDDKEEDNSMHLPTDRSHPLPGVLHRRQEHQIEFDRDEKILVSQLGYMPGNAVGVVGRVDDLKVLYPSLHKLIQKLDLTRNQTVGGDEYGNTVDVGAIPTSLQLYPLAIRNVHKGGKSGRKFKSRKRGHEEISKSDKDEVELDLNLSDEDKLSKIAEDEKNKGTHENTVIEPFPTMYWLTHPVLKTLISQLELSATEGVIPMEEKLHSKPEYLEAMEKAHKSYGQHRWNMLTDIDKEDLIQKGWKDAVGEIRGVAGIRKFETIKCLHTHSAHYLAYLGDLRKIKDESSNTSMDENLVGKWAFKCLEEIAKKHVEQYNN